MPLSLVCASHTPMLNRLEIDPALARAVHSGFAELQTVVERFEPDLIIQFAPDHYQGFFHRLMPSFCVGLAAVSARDWDIAPGDIAVPQAAAKDLVNWLLDDGFDVASSRAMVLDHGFLQMWQEMRGGFAGLPILPIFINCAAPPLPRYRRIRQLGLSVGRFALARNQRVLLAASGGLSHDVPIPDIDNAPAETRDRLLHGTPLSPQDKARREDLLTELGRQAAQGQGPCGPLNPAWDRRFLDILASGQLDRCDDFEEAEVRRVAGRAANEVLCWLAATAALSAGGAYTMTTAFYEPIPAWIAGMALATGAQRP